jgi:DNA invertase Pin-like site-specific DNA recombinase
MSDDTKILAQIAEAEYENRLAEIRAQIEDAQAKGESKRRDRLYQQELALIAKVKGNGPIVNGRRTA